MKNPKRAVLRLLERSEIPLTTRQIRKRLGIKKSKHVEIRQILLSFVEKGKLIQVQNKFTLSNVDIPPVPSSSKHKEQAQPSLENYSGKFTKTSKGYGFVLTGKSEDIFIAPEHQLNAMEGDRVEVLLATQRQGRRLRGKITKVIKRAKTHIVAKIVKGVKATLAVPVNPQSVLPPIIIEESEYRSQLESGSLVEVELLDSPSEREEIFGRILRILPAFGVDELAFEMIVIENQIETNFDASVLQQANSYPTSIRYSSQSGRVDLRKLGFVTIDGKTARDFDDAVFVKKESEQTYRLYVAIADVAHYVRANDLIDQVAYQRGTSVYFPTHAIPMLPENLSNHLCSLKPNVNRYALTCEMNINDEGEVIEYDIYESVIRSQARLYYEDVTTYLEQKPSRIQKPTLQKNLDIMWELAQILREKRRRRGAIEFSFPELQPIFNQKKEMLGLEKKYQSISMSLIEQFMLEANETVAKHGVKTRLPILYRVHDQPDIMKLKKMQETFSFLGIQMKTAKMSDSKKFNQVLAQVKNFPNKNQIQILLLRSMALAQYRPNNEGHFGLSATYYTHFTSPIRRYPDLIVHRALKEQIRSRKLKKRTRYLPITEEMAQFLSQRERKAEIAERQSNQLLLVIYLEKYLGENFEATILSINPSGVEIELHPVEIEWFLPLEVISDDDYKYDAMRLCLFGKYKKRTVKGGEMLRLQLVRTDRMLRSLDFLFETWLH